MKSMAWARSTSCRL